MTSPNTYTLRARCSTWDAVEDFYKRRVMAGGLLSARVPFVPQPGDRAAVALELPDEMVMAIDGVVRKVGVTAAGKTPIVIRLVGFNETAIARLEALIAEGRAEEAEVEVPAPRARSQRVRPPPPRPEDAPVDIRIEPDPPADPSALDPETRAVYDELVAELGRLRELDAAAVIGCEPGADLAAVRRGYIEQVLRHHPDVLAHHRSPAVARAAEELFIFVNRAFDRLRLAARSAGETAVAGSAIRPELGWVIDVSDLGVAPPGVGSPRSLEADDLFRDVDETSPRGEAAVSLSAPRTAPEPVVEEPEPRMSMSELVAEAAASAERGDYGRASELYAEALGLEPRDRKLRARYHLTRGRQLIAKGDRVGATTQVELALSHDPDNQAAAEILGEMRGQTRRRRSRISRWLRGDFVGKGRQPPAKSGKEGS